jgi:hypothetical protein
MTSSSGVDDGKCMHPVTLKLNSVLTDAICIRTTVLRYENVLRFIFSEIGMKEVFALC